ncbi:hypothetical protein [Citrobacter enshiensis]|uniref:hypothetical protein n=1 Tax=Citrobacter enshiensis TaxID=2971264 RepID=UPI0023E79677|nr:hypothetical protein [Citrobacter enshiensis]WET41654.1 hypothetical protein P2W74_05315 [Citrobacter enshiensis]
MFGLETLDVLIGLMTVYFTFGIACTAIVEAISAWTNIRSKNLEMALKELFSGELAPNEQFITQFYAHPLIQSLSKGKNGLPSYIPPEIVGQVVESLVVGKSVMATLCAGVNTLPGTAENNRIKGILETVVMQTENDATQFRQAVAKQFDAVMDRASGWYKRKTQTITLIVAALLVLSGNVDSINIATVLASNPATREKMVNIAQQTLTNAKAQAKEANNKTTNVSVKQATDQVTDATAQYDRAVSALQATGLSFGWKGLPQNVWEYLAKAAGLLVTIFAVSLGGQFWFDTLQRVMQIRSTGPKPSDPDHPARKKK